jgi:hypothetical protein
MRRHRRAREPEGGEDEARRTIAALTLCVWTGLAADPRLTGRELLDRLQEIHPGEYPDNLIRAVQRRLKVWRRERAKALVLGPSSTAGANSPEPDPPPTDAPADAQEHAR